LKALVTAVRVSSQRDRRGDGDSLETYSNRLELEVDAHVSRAIPQQLTVFELARKPMISP